MGTIEQRFQSFITRVRPHRIAVFTNVDDIHWQHSCVGILEFFTKLWGGSHCVIIPTDGRKIDEEFWAILSFHDPDLLYKYQSTGADYKIRAPAEFNKLNSINIAPQPIPLSQQNSWQVIRWGISPRTHLQTPFPLGLTRAALTAVRATASRRYLLPTVVVVGDSVKDFCLYHALYWQQGRALWLPSWFMLESGEYPERLMTAIREAEESGQYEHNEELSLVSYSVAKTKLEELKNIITPRLFRTRVSVNDISTAMVELQLEYPSRVYADGNIGDVTTHLLLNNNLPGWFDSPLPRMLHPVNPLSHRWIVDITFLQHLIPRHPALGRIAVHGPNLSEVRAGSECVSYMCPGMLVMGDHMETNMLRPSIHVPDAEEIFRFILDECGYQSKTSDKGRYEAESVYKFGGLEKAGYALSSQKYRNLLMKFLDKSPSQKGVHDEGVYLKDQRRYLNFVSVSKILNSDVLAREIIDEYVEKSIFYRGYIFLCENCSDGAWHSISEVDQTFTCKRCGVKQQYKFRSWKHPNEPSWFYKLDEMAYLMLAHNGHVPVLTLNKLRMESKESFMFRPEVRLTPTGSTKIYLEIDVCCIANARLCIGEAKSNDSLAGNDLTPMQTAERYRELALKMGASIVVFATTEISWNQPSREAMKLAFKDYPHIEVLKLTAATLYS
jgi:hypothetical protein